MSYNSRRGGGYGPQSSSQVGQRRPPGTPQHMGNQGQLPQMQHGRGRTDTFGGKQNSPQQPNQMQRQQNLRQQAEKYLQQPPPQSQQPPPQSQPEPPKPVVVAKVEVPEVVPEPVQPPTNGTIADEPSVTPAAGEEDAEKTRKGKPFWVKGSGKINKKELRRRRNLRLRKMLQPKNALMVLNELVGSTKYEVTDAPDMFSGTLFKCTVLVDGIEHVGVGKSKPGSKNAAAESALKYMVLNKVNISPPPPDTSGKQELSDTSEMKMDIDENVEGISWSHVACYALHKLLNSWDDGNSNLTSSNLNLSTDKGPAPTPDIADPIKLTEKKPAKKLPNNAETMNPVMLLNQMLPSATFEEVSKEGLPPNVQFTVKCVIGKDEFYGTAPTKKGSRKLCAFAACQNALNMQYSPAFLEDQGFSEDAVRVVLGGSN